MALPSLLRRSVSRAAPLAARFLSGHASLHTYTPSLYAVVQSNLAAKVVAPTLFRNYSASSTALKTSSTSDQTLLKVIDAEIVCAEETDENPEVFLLIRIVVLFLFFLFLFCKMYLLTHTIASVEFRTLDLW